MILTVSVDNIFGELDSPILQEIRNLLLSFIDLLNLGLTHNSIWYSLMVFGVVLLVIGLLDVVMRLLFVSFLPKLLRMIPALEYSGVSAKRVTTKMVRSVSVFLLLSLLPVVFPSKSLWGVVFSTACKVWLAIVVTQLFARLFDALRGSMLRNAKYRNSPFVNLFQFFKSIVYFIAALIIVSILFSLDMKTIGASLTALSAVLMLVFKDSILGFVASIQLSANDMVRVGDWITVPSQGVDGEVMDISLATIKVKNFDMTVSTLPPYSLMSASVQNWRPMQELGARRVKRSLFIDMQTIKYADADLLERLKNSPELRGYINTAVEEIKKDNADRGVTHSFSKRGLTNIGIFRRYIQEYLKNHPGVNCDLTCIVRQLQPIETGLPLELYFFVNTSAWANYEAIQSDIFDHLMAVISVFDLNIFQNINGSNVLPIGDFSDVKPETTGEE